MPAPVNPLFQLVADKTAQHNLKALRAADRTDPANRAAYIAARRAYKRDLSKAIRDAHKAQGGV